VLKKSLISIWAYLGMYGLILGINYEHSVPIGLFIDQSKCFQLIKYRLSVLELVLNSLKVTFSSKRNASRVLSIV
jgi:hypothetical protein